MLYYKRSASNKNELHDYIKENYKSTCCRVITRNYEFASEERRQHCITITGLVAAWVADKLIEDGVVSASESNI
ncbi:C-GCAxxG-C-C family protein [Peptoclostridium litorale]|uniref:C-GCAxxG-C-C family protein n=1 Tax=Peptoclostridium litorale TaxID=1557 RepID=UPI002FE5F6A3